MSFKLYDMLEQDISTYDKNDKSVSQEWFNNFRNIIKKLPQDKIDNIYLLIKYHHYITEKNDKDIKDTINDIPYGGKQLKSSIKFDIELFPQKLKKMILVYVNKN